MKHLFINLTFLFLFIISVFHQLHAEGFAAGTMIKVPDGYTIIENLHIGDYVVCYDSNKNYIASKVACINKKSVEQCVRIAISEESLSLACDQRLYKEDNNTWVAAESLQNGDVLAGQIIDVELIDQPIDVYLLSVAQYHNFFVTKADLCAHNFFPPIVLAISAAFGLGSVELAGVSCGLAAVGAFLGYQWQKKDEDQHKVVIEPQFYGGGMMPEDPEEDKKRRRNEAREEYRSLTRKEAKEIAKDFGHREVKGHPCGNTRNQPVFFNGKNYISPDIDGHNGGMWKVFDRRGNILHTASRRFEKIVKVYKK